LWDLQTLNKLGVIKSHNNNVSSLIYGHNTLYSGSWDKTVKCCDIRLNNQTKQINNKLINLDERVFTMHTLGNILAIGTANRKISIYDLRNTDKPLRGPYDSPLKYQTRVIRLFNDSTCFAIGSIEGRCGIQYIQENDQNKNFAFKCHREDNEVFAVNSISIHPVFGTFATAGADGNYVFWDKDSKQRLKQFVKQKNSITASNFNPSGSLYVYAIGYDWSRGIEFHEKFKTPNTIMIHQVKEEEIKSRSNNNNNNNNPNIRT